ncbi:MAG TPA: 50S ribosomal protein L30 [archaeon]|nr:50S ribosomal protein L30 [archaeon]
MIAAIRVRGTVNVSPQITTALESLMLYKPNHLVLVNNDKGGKKMLEKVRDYVTFGEIGEATLGKLLTKRARLEGDERVTLEFLKGKKISGFEALAKQVLEGKVKLRDLGIKPVLRLHPPRKGHKRAGTKIQFSLGGALGDRGKEIDVLIAKMS